MSGDTRIPQGAVVFVGGWCGNPKCACYKPGLPCDEYMGPADEDDDRCPCCSWSEAAHTIPADPNPFPWLRLWGRRRETLSDDRSDW